MGHDDVAAFLANALDPPSAGAVQSALLTLIEVGALSLPEVVTPPTAQKCAEVPRRARI